MVEHFFQDDVNPRVMLGKNDVLSVKAGTGLKEKKQKILLLDETICITGTILLILRIK